MDAYEQQYALFDLPFYSHLLNLDSHIEIHWNLWDLFYMFLEHPQNTSADCVTRCSVKIKKVIEIQTYARVKAIFIFIM